MYWPLGVPSVYTASGTPDRGHDDGEDGGPGGLPDGKVTDGSRSSLDPGSRNDIEDIDASRTGEVFATATRDSISIWQTKPTVVLAVIVRSAASVDEHGHNVSVHMQPDASFVTVRTAKHALSTYALRYVVDACVYQTRVRSALLGASGSRRSLLPPEYQHGPGDGQGIRKVAVEHKTTVVVEHGIDALIALDGEILLSSSLGPALMRLDVTESYDTLGPIEHITQLPMLPWLAGEDPIVSMSHDRPMRLHVWLTLKGRAYAVQRPSLRQSSAGDKTNGRNPLPFTGFCFHNALSAGDRGMCAAINARFSMIAIGCSDSSIHVYHARDYNENITISHRLDLPVAAPVRGKLLCLRYSPDGHALFAGFSKGWAMFSVYGHLGANSFGIDQETARTANQQWLLSARRAFWMIGGVGLVFLGEARDKVYSVECVRSSVTSCFSMANVSRMTLQTGTSIMLHRGLDDTTDVASSMTGSSVWQNVQLPSAFLSRQWPVRCSVISADGSYLAVAGRRGIAHYGVSSGRWRTFDDVDDEDEYVVRGGMCWHQHVLVTAVDADGSFEIRLYSREKALVRANVMHTEYLDHAVVHMAVTGDDSLLVYTHENMLHHFVFVADAKDETVRIEQVGKIGFRGIIRAPSRVRAMDWVIPDEQREHGLPSQDVAMASIIFLVDAKLAFLRPTSDADGGLRYDMRVIAHNVEYYFLTKDTSLSGSTRTGPMGDALMVFNGKSMLLWPDLQKLLDSTPGDVEQDMSQVVVMTPEFYPLGAVLETGVLSGVESEVMQRHDGGFAHCRLQCRTHLAIPGLVGHFLSISESASALRMCESYRELPYFAHSLEVLLHDVLEEVSQDDLDDSHRVHEGDDGDDDTNGSQVDVLPRLLTFMSSFPCYLDVIVGCTRKSEMRTWQTLFKYLPPVTRLFDESLSSGSLRTAGGLLLILHNFDEKCFDSSLMARLVKAASMAGDWDLCKELARFLVGIDESGKLLGDTLAEAGLFRQSVGARV